MSIDGRTRLAFLLGYPVEHSLSPAMHQAAFAATGLNAVYLPWSVSPAFLPDAVRGLRTFRNLLGANVTVPHKQAVIPLLDGLTPDAEAMGAVNTILCREDTLVGENTDGAGFLMSLREAVPHDLSDLTAVVLGAGGAARSVAMSLARAGVRRLLILNRTLEHARGLAETVAVHVPACEVAAHSLQPGWRADLVGELHLLVNTTSVGLRPTDPPLFDYAGLSAATLVCDLIYRPAETPLLAAARQQGCRTVNGLSMLLHQGALAFERWVGRGAPIGAMRQALGLP